MQTNTLEEPTFIFLRFNLKNNTTRKQTFYIVAVSVYLLVYEVVTIW
jgi:hypothetical protein